MSSSFFFFFPTDAEGKTFEFLNSLIKRKVSGKGTCFYSLEGLDDSFITYIEQNIERCRQVIAKEGNYYDLVLLKAEGMKYKFHDAVKARNRDDDKSIVLFTNGTVKMVDSLKDFVQLDIYSLDFKSEIAVSLEDVLDKDGSISWMLKDRKYDHMSNIFQIVRPKPQDFIKYIIKAGEDFKKLGSNENKKFLVLNCNLDIVGLWRSFSTSYIGKTKTKKMLKYSRIDVIKKKLEDIQKINNIKRTDIKIDESSIEIVTGLSSSSINTTEIKNKLKRYTGNNRDILREVFFEFVESLFKGSTRKAQVEKENERERFENIYTAFIDFLNDRQRDLDNYRYMDIGGKRVLEDGKLIIEKFTDAMHGIFKPLNDGGEILFEGDETDFCISYQIEGEGEEEAGYQKTYDLQNENREYALFKMNFPLTDDIILIDCGEPVSFEMLIDIIRSKRTNLQEKRNELIGLLESLREARSELLDANFCYVPKLFKDWIKILKYIESYFDVLKALYKYGNMLIYSNLAENRFIDYLLNIDSVITPDSVKISCYNPVMLFRSLVTNKIYKDFITRFRHDPLGLKIIALKKLTSQFPVEKLVWGGKPYFFREQPGNTYFREAFPAEKAESFENMDTYRLYEKIDSYIGLHRYKSELNIGLAGYVNIPVLKQLAVRLLAKNKNSANLKRISLNIACLFKERAKDEILFNTEHDELFKESIGFSLQDWPSDNNVGEFLEAFVKSNDLVFLLDPSFMYAPLACEDDRDSGMLMFIAEKRELENEIRLISEYVSDNSHGVPVIPGIINNLNIYSYTHSIYNGYWKKYSIKTGILNSIASTIDMSNKENKTVYLYSGNASPEDFIDNFDNIEEMQKDINGLNEISIIKFAKCVREGETWIQDFLQKPCIIRFSLWAFVKRMQVDLDNANISEAFVEGYDDENVQDICGRIYIELDYTDLINNLKIKIYFNDRDYNGSLLDEDNIVVNDMENEGDRPSRKGVVSFVRPYMQSVFYPYTQDDWYCKKVFEKVLLESSSGVNDIIFTHIYSNKFDKIGKCKRITIGLAEEMTLEQMDTAANHRKYNFLRLVKILDRERLIGRDIDNILRMYKNDKDRLNKDLHLIRETSGQLGYLDSEMCRNIDRGLLI